MAKAQVRLSLGLLSIPAKVVLLRKVVTQSTGNTHLDATKTGPMLTGLTNKANTLEAKFGVAEVKRQESQTATAEQNTAEKEADTAVTEFAKEVENETHGVREQILSTGLDARDLSTTPIGTLDQVVNFSITTGDDPGKLDTHWNRVHGAKSYILEKSLDPITATSWTPAGVVTASKATISALTSGTKYWLRVAAIGAAGQGPWSDPATMVAQ